jgi:heterodisulfide reductase subunit C
MLDPHERDEIVRMTGINPRKCMLCGKCSASCPSYDEMEYHPHEFVNMVERGDIDPLKDSPSFYKCLSCFACVERCPRGVEPARFVEAVRLRVIRKQGGNHLSAEAIAALADENLPQQAIVSAFRKYSK